MAKPNCENLTNTKSWVVMNFGWYGKYFMPVAAAAETMRIIVESGAVLIDLQCVGKSFYVPKKLDIKIECLDNPFFGDVPIESAPRDEYLKWLKMKSELVGKGYEPEPYAAYLAAKEEGYDPSNL